MIHVIPVEGLARSSLWAWLGWLALAACSSGTLSDGGETPIVDADGDGYTTQVDCDDADAAIHPSAADVCGDGVDQDCAGGDLVCPACNEGAVLASGCTCEAARRTTGYCCSDVWQSATCGGTLDTTPPLISGGEPTGTLPAGTTDSTLSVTTDEAATCKVDLSAGTSYAAMPYIFATTGGTSHSTPISGLADGQSYTLYVRCQDGTGNANSSDYAVSFSVASFSGAPVISAGQPTGSLPAGTTQTTMSVMTDEAATCKWDSAGATTFDAMPNTFTTTGGTSHSTQLTGLSDGQSYSFYVRCQDGLGNANTTSYEVNFTVGAPSSNVFEAYFETEPLGANYVSVGYPGGEFTSQKTEDPYSVTPVPPDSATVNITVVNFPTAPQGGQVVRLSRKSDDFTERRAQLSVFCTDETSICLNSGMSALTTYYVHFKMYLPDNYTVYPWDGQNMGWLRLWEFLEFGGSQGLWYGMPAFHLKPGVANKLKITLYFGANAQDEWELGGTVPANQWVEFVVEFTRGITNGAVTVWQDGVPVLNVSNVQTTYNGAQTFFSLDASGMAVSPSPMTVYFDDVQINQANIW